jgi:sterol desaturase/sphingolipid hydroxylase (fatty acid hydroxylase superfamily)
MEILQTIDFFFSDFINPKKRVFVGYLGLALIIALAWLVLFQRGNLRSALRKIFDPKVFFSKSATIDYAIFLLNRVLALILAPLLLSQLAISTAIYFALVGSDWLSLGQFAGLGKGWVIALFTIAIFLGDDFSKYLLHRWMHRWPLLWAIHKVHHSAETLTPLTVYRVHPLEGILYTTRGTIVQGVIIPIFLFLFSEGINLYTIAGVNVFTFVFHVTGSNLRHSHVDIHYWRWLERVLISPAQHQVHHSLAEEHYDKNFGAALALWDWIFGSLHLSKAGDELNFGLREDENLNSGSLKAMYISPMTEMGRIIVRNALRVGQAGITRIVNRR